MCNDTLWLPGLVRLEDYGQDPGAYLDAVYQCFWEDFVDSRPWLGDRIVKINTAPIHDGKETTFWHIVSEGGVEMDRLPNLRRWECIRWPRSVIENAGDPKRVIRWRVFQRGEWKLKLSLPDFSYLVVLADRTKYLFLKTAFPVDRTHTYEAVQREYNECRGAVQEGRSPPV